MKTSLALWFVLAGFLPAAEQDWTAWQWESPFDVREAGIVHLEIPPPALDVARTDLGDLRVLSPAGAETGYLVDVPNRQPGNERDAAGFRVTLAERTTVIEVSPQSADAIEAVQLVSPAREFLKSVTIEGRRSGGEWQTLATNEVIFRQSASAERLRVPIASGTWENLRFTVNDDRSRPVPFTGVRLTSRLEKPPTAEFPVTLGKREEQPGESRLTLDLGARNLNVAELRLEIPGAVFSRTCTVSFSSPAPGGQNHTETLASSAIYRITGDRNTSAESLEIAIHRRIPTRFLTATFRNGDSAPLTVTGAKVRCYPTVLAFHAEPAGTWRLLTGNSTATARNYLLNPMRGALTATGGQRLPAGPLRSKADFQVPPALPGVEPAGAHIDLAKWSRRRKVIVDSASPGVIRIELDARAVAGCQLDLGDLRLIQNDRQIPYVTSPAVVRELTASMVLLPNDPKHPTVSNWEVTLPTNGLPAFELTATSPAPLFSRRFDAFIERHDELGNSWTENIGSAEWAKSQGHETLLGLSLLPGGQRMPAKLRLQTDHGDNPPILLENPRVRYRAPLILAKVTAAAPLFVVYGNSEATKPEYDLRLVQQELMAAEPRSATLGDEEILRPDARPPGAPDAGSPWLWIALAGVVAALLAVVAKLLPRPAAE